MDQKKKTVFQLDSPYTQTQWPEISIQDQDTILELLCSLLSPIGQWRSENITPSQGKRCKKRKRQEAKSNKSANSQQSKPPRPEISSFVEIGLNSITRRVESSSSQDLMPKDGTIKSSSTKEIIQSGNTDGVKSDAIRAEQLDEENHDQKSFVAVFAVQSPQSTLLHAHFQHLVRTSLANPSLQTTRHVQLPVGSGARLCAALGLARVSFIGILEGAPHSTALVDLIRRVVQEVEVPWLKEMKDAAYLPVNIKAIETTIGVSKEKKQDKQKST